MKKQMNRLNVFDRIMMAVTFAEIDEPKTALRMLEKQSSKKNRNRVSNQEEQRPTMRA